MSIQNVKRHQIFKEMVSTEQSYVSQLNLVTATIIPFLSSELTRAEASSVFNNLESLYTTNQAFLAELESALSQYDETKTLIAPIFLKYVPFLAPYKQYAANYDNARETWLKLMEKKSFATKMGDFFRSDPSKFRGNTDLFHYLIMPIQRVPRYVLLLNEIIKESQRHGDLKALNQAVSLVQVLATDINSQIKSSQSSQKLLQLSTALGMDSELMYKSYRTFLKQGTFYKHLPRADSGLKVIEQLPTTPQVSRPAESSVSPSSPSTTKGSATSKEEKIKASPLTISPNKNEGKKETELTKSELKDRRLYEQWEEQQRRILLEKRQEAMSDPVILYHFFLFSDLLLYASEVGKKFSTHQVIAITPDLELLDPDPSQPFFWLVRDHFQFQLKLSIPDQDKKKDWVGAIQDCIQQAALQQFPTNNLDIQFAHQINIPTQEGTTCSNCCTGFSIATHRHSCKFCCQLICDACGPNYVQINNNQKEKGLRICKQCEGVRDQHGISKQPVKCGEVGDKSTKHLLVSTKGTDEHRKKLADFAKQLSLPPRYFVVSNRYHVATFNAQRVGQNGHYFPIVLNIFNDLVVISQQTVENGVHPHHQIVPIDQLTTIKWQTSKVESKNIDWNFRKQVNTEEAAFKQDPKSIYNTQFPFYLQRERLLIKLYFSDQKIKTSCGGIISGLVSQSKTRVPCQTSGCSNLDLLYYNQVPVEQADGCTNCEKSFGFFRGNVTCNFCQLNFCKTCSNSTAPAFPLDSCTVLTRCCDKCKLDRSKIVPKYSWFF